MAFVSVNHEPSKKWTQALEGISENPTYWANTVMKKTIESLIVLPVWELQGLECHRMCCWSGHNTQKFTSIAVFIGHLAFSWRKSLLFTAPTMKEMDFCLRTCRFTLKTRSHKWCNHQYQVWAACSLLCYSQSSSLSCRQRKVTQHRPEAVLSMQCSTGEHSL